VALPGCERSPSAVGTKRGLEKFAASLRRPFEARDQIAEAHSSLHKIDADRSRMVIVKELVDSGAFSVYGGCWTAEAACKRRNPPF
jgi:hypothetical protein